MLPVIGKKGPWAEMVSSIHFKQGCVDTRGQAIAHTEVLLCSNYIQDSLRLPDYEQNPIVAYDVQAKLVSCVFLLLSHLLSYNIQVVYRAFLRWFTATNNDRWALPVLWTICNDLRELAIEVSGG